LTETANPTEESYYILATSARVETRPRVLKQGQTFAIFDRSGDMNGARGGQEGLFHRGTRYLSRCSLSLGPTGPLLLSSVVPEDNARMLVDLTNPDIFRNGVRIAHGLTPDQSTRQATYTDGAPTIQLDPLGLAPRDLASVAESVTRMAAA